MEIILKTQCCFSDIPDNHVANCEEEDNDDIVDIPTLTEHDNTETTASVNFEYPSGSNVCQRYSIKANNAEAAGTVAATASARRRYLNRGRGRHHVGVPVNNRVYLKHQDINQLCETYSNNMEPTTAATNQCWQASNTHSHSNTIRMQHKAIPAQLRSCAHKAHLALEMQSK